MRMSTTCFLLALCAAGAAHAQADAPAKAKPCTAPEYRQFDFWLGDWNVKDASGKDAGTNHLVAMHGGCVMRESWASTGDAVTGSSLTGYDKVDGGKTWSTAFDGFYTRQ